MKRAVFNINTCDRQIIIKLHKNQDKVIWRASATEMDTSYFEDSEWAALSNDTRRRITEDLVRIKFLANKKRRTTSSINA